MKIAIAGKGGTGKTTIAGTLARVIARRGHAVWAIDADSNPNLGVTLGLAPGDGVPPPLPRSLLQEGTDAEGKRTVSLARPAAEIVAEYGARAPDDIRLLVMGRIDHAGAG